MQEKNPFDQFDTGAGSPAPQANPFDQFDTPASSPITPVASTAPAQHPASTNSIGQLQNVANDLSLNARRRQAEQNMAEQVEAANQKKGSLQRFREGSIRGMTKQGVGLFQTLGIGDREDLDQIGRNLKLQGKGAGFSGALGEVTTPINVGLSILPGGLPTLAATGAVMGALEPTTGTSRRTQNVLAGAAFNTVLPPVIGGVTGALGSAAQGIANKTGLTALATKVSDFLGANPTMSKIYQAAKETGFDTTGKSPKEIADNLQAWLSANTKGAAKSISGEAFNPVDANVAISKQYGKALEASKGLYDTAREIGANEVVPAEGINENINGLIKNLQDKTLRTSKENGALSKLLELKNTIASNTKTPAGYNVVNDAYLGTKVPEAVSANTLIDLKQLANQYFDKSEPDPFFSRIASIAKNGLKQASENNPEFGQALSSADQYWGKEVAPVYKDNKLLDKFWNTDDFHDANALANRGQALPLELRKRASEWIEKIKSPEELESLTNALPKEQANVLRAQKFTDLMQKSGFDAKSIADPRKYAVMQQILKDKPEAQETIKNIRTVLADLNLRGLDNSMPDNVAREVMQGNKSSEALRAAWSGLVGKRMYAVSHAAKAIAGVDSATGEALKQFQGALKQGAPYKNTISNAAKAIAPGIGKIGAATLENKMEQP